MKHARNKMKHAKKEDKRRRPAVKKEATPAVKVYRFNIDILKFYRYIICKIK